MLRISNGIMSFDLQFEGKYNLIIGDSGTGKTTLYNMLNDYNTSPELFTFECNHDVVVWERKWGAEKLAEFKDKLIVMDEYMQILKSPDLCNLLIHSENYFLIFNRKILKFLPIGVDNVFTLKTDENNKHTLEPAHTKPVTKKMTAFG